MVLNQLWIPVGRLQVVASGDMGAIEDSVYKVLGA